MKIAVISDTHSHSIENLAPRILLELRQADMIVHAGDAVTAELIEGLRRLGPPLKAVQGNMDAAELKRSLPVSDVFDVEGRKIGLIHGWGSPNGIEERVRTAFTDVDVIIFGHSHKPENAVIDGVLYFNPGDARHSFGILDIGREISGRIIKL